MKRTKLSPTGLYISKHIGHAIGAYDMIREGDRIMVGVSGGKDSLALLKMLRERQLFAPIKFSLHAVTICVAPEPQVHLFEDVLKPLYERWQVPYTFTAAAIEMDQNKTNCFWCSWNRRKLLFRLADELGCNKMALGHHHDDIIETTVMNMFFSGDISTMNPCQPLFEGRMTVIRPLCYVNEAALRTYAAEEAFPVIDTPCPYGKDSNRAFIKELIRTVEQRSPNVRKNIFRSIGRIREEYIDIRGHERHNTHPDTDETGTE